MCVWELALLKTEYETYPWDAGNNKGNTCQTRSITKLKDAQQQLQNGYNTRTAKTRISKNEDDEGAHNYKLEKNRLSNIENYTNLIGNTASFCLHKAPQREQQNSAFQIKRVHHPRDHASLSV